MVKIFYLVSGYIENKDLLLTPIHKDHIGVLPVFKTKESAEEYAKTIKNSIVLPIKMDVESDIHII